MHANKIGVVTNPEKIEDKSGWLRTGGGFALYNGPGPRLGPKGFTEGGRTAVWRTVGKRTA